MIHETWKNRRIIDANNFPRHFDKRACHIVSGIAGRNIELLKVTSNLLRDVNTIYPVTRGKYNLYCLVLGERGAGKSEMISAQLPEKYPWCSYEPSTFVRVNKHKFLIMNVPVNLKSVEIPGANGFSGPPKRDPWLPLLYEEVSSIVLVFNFNDFQTFMGMVRWYDFYVKPKFIDNLCDEDESPPLFVVGTNFRPRDHYSLESRAIKFANMIGAEYWAIHVKDGRDPVAIRFFDRLAAVTFHYDLEKRLKEYEN